MGLSPRGRPASAGASRRGIGRAGDPGPSWGRLDAPQRRGLLWIVRGDPAGGPFVGALIEACLGPLAHRPLDLFRPPSGPYPGPCL